MGAPCGRARARIGLFAESTGPLSILFVHRRLRAATAGRIYEMDQASAFTSRICASRTLKRPQRLGSLFACADFEHPGATLRARSFRRRASVLHGDGLGTPDLALSLALHAVTSGGAS